jgi:hypothetical protein
VCFTHHVCLLIRDELSKPYEGTPLYSALNTAANL